jgi:transposase-like protein
MTATGPRTNHQSRVDWWRAQFQRQRKANLSVTDLCRQLGVSVTTFYYWKKRVDEAPADARGQVPGVRPSRHATTAANFVPVSILEPAAGTELEIELTNACVLRLKGVIDVRLLQAAITAAGQLDGSREGAT